MTRHNPQDEESSKTMNADSAWGVLYAQRKNGEISDADFRRQRRRLLVVMIGLVAISIASVALKLR